MSFKVKFLDMALDFMDGKTSDDEKKCLESVVMELRKTGSVNGHEIQNEDATYILYSPCSDHVISYDISMDRREILIMDISFPDAI